MSDPRNLGPLEDPKADTDPRSDIEKAVEARKDAVERGEGGPATEEATGVGGESGADGVVKNQDETAQ